MARKSAQPVELNPNEDALANINRKYVYVLAEKNQVNTRPRVFDGATGMPIKEPEYKQRQNLLLKSSIVWDGSEDPWSGKPRKAGKYFIRYYDGCTTLFVDDQPKENDAIEKFMVSTRELYFIEGHLEVYGYDVMLKAYLDMASWNGESPYRVRTVKCVYVELDSDKQLMEESQAMDKADEASEKAKNAKVSHMRIHCKFLHIPDIDLKTQNPLSDTSIRILYRKEAQRDPVNFIKTFNDKTIHVQYWIEKALDTGDISTNIIPNQAVWKNKGAPICDISGLKSKEGILNKLIEFSQAEEGFEFLEQLKITYE